MNYIDDALVQAVAHSEPLGCAGNIAHQNVDTRSRRTQSHYRSRAEPAQAIVARTAFPLLFRHTGTLLCFFLHRLVNALRHRLRVAGCGQVDCDLIPHPLPGGGEVEVLSTNRKAVEESDAAAGWMTPVRQIPGFKQGSAHKADLGNLAADAVDLHPIAYANAVLADKDEPAKKRDHEILHRDGQPSGCQTENCRHLPRPSEDDKQNEQTANCLYNQLQDGAEGLRLPPVERWIGHQPPHKRIAEHDADEDKGDQRQRLQNQMPQGAVLQKHLGRPLAVDGGKLLLGLNAVITDGEKLALLALFLYAG